MIDDFGTDEIVGTNLISPLADLGPFAFHLPLTMALVGLGLLFVVKLVDLGRQDLQGLSPVRVLIPPGDINLHLGRLMGHAHRRSRLILMLTSRTATALELDFQLTLRELVLPGDGRQRQDSNGDYGCLAASAAFGRRHTLNNVFAWLVPKRPPHSLASKLDKGMAVFVRQNFRFEAQRISVSDIRSNEIVNKQFRVLAADAELKFDDQLVGMVGSVKETPAQVLRLRLES